MGLSHFVGDALRSCTGCGRRTVAIFILAVSRLGRVRFDPLWLRMECLTQQQPRDDLDRHHSGVEAGVVQLPVFFGRLPEYP